MPGIFGAYKESKKEMLPDLRNRMAASLSMGRKLRVDQVIDMEKGVFLARVSLGILNAVDQPIQGQAEGGALCWTVFHGELYNNPGPLSDPAYVHDLYLKKGDSCVLELNGIFHFVIYDEHSGQIKLFSDKFGLQPLYYALLPDGIVFAAEVKGILQEKSIRKDPDYQSFADCYHFGILLGNKTLFADIKLLPPGSVFTFDLKARSCRINYYSNLKNFFCQKGGYNNNLTSDSVVDALIEAIGKRRAQKEILGLSLSGGLDSRGILAGLAENSRNIFTYTLGLQGCADQKLSQKMAEVAHTRHEFVELGQSYLKDFQNMANSMILFSDGMFHPHESTEMLALAYFQRAPFQILLRGHGGEIAKASLAYPVMVTPEIHSCHSGKEVLGRIYAKTNLVLPDSELSQLLTPPLYKQVRDGAMTSLRQSCEEVRDLLSPGDICIYYYIKEHIRRHVVASLDIFRTEIEIRMPYLDEDFIKLLLQLPIARRNQGEVHFRLIKKCMPALISIPNSNTGAPLDAGRVRLFVIDKFSSLMRKLGIRGFRHYTEFQKWQRDCFRETTEKILFSSELKNRDIYNLKALRDIFTSHISGQRNYGHLLGTLVGLELWYRNFVD